MTFKEILTRITGVSTPIFGVSWDPPKAERTVARKVIQFLEDRRVLYNPSELEIPDHCVASVLEIRQFLTDQISALDDKSELAASLRAMRAACRKFLDSLPHRSRSLPPMYWAAFDSWAFITALGELRGVFGVHLAKIAAQNGLDIEDDLAAILPAPGDKDAA